MPRVIDRPTFVLANRALNGGLPSILRTLRNDGLAYREIADRLRQAHHLDVSHELVRLWCLDLEHETGDSAA